jgi:hypothetical protein
MMALAPLLGGCGGFSLSDYSVPTFNMPRGDIFNSSQFSFTARHEDFSLPPPPPSELITQEGQCAAAAGGQEGSGIALQMTECEVVRRAGSPDKIEYPPGRFDRAVILTYIRGPRPGIYSFFGGRLVSIDRVAEPPAQQRPAKKAART